MDITYYENWGCFIGLAKTTHNTYYFTSGKTRDSVINKLFNLIKSDGFTTNKTGKYPFNTGWRKRIQEEKEWKNFLKSKSIY